MPGRQLLNNIRQHAQKWLAHVIDHVWPHDGNKHLPHILKHRVLMGYSVILILVKVLVIVAPIALPSSSLFSSSITPENIINLTNQTRINLGLPELEINNQLGLAAKLKAEDMITNQYFAHTSPSGTSPWDWIKNAGYKYQYAGENLAVNFFSAEGVSDGWLASPSHRANIVNPYYTEIGVGVVNGIYNGQSTSMVVQMFGTPPGQAVTTAAVVLPPEPAATKVSNPVPAPTPTPVPQPQPVEPQPEPQPIAIAPTPEPQPEPQPQPINPVGTPKEEPVVVEPVIIPAPGVATVNFEAAQVVRDGNTYKISVPVTDAKLVTAHLAQESINLAKSRNSNLWSGVIPFDASVFGKNGEVLSVVAISPDGEVTTSQLAWLAPDVPTQQLYNFNTTPDKYAKFFGFLMVHNLDDSVSRFYLYFMVALAAALLINILVKIRIQHISVLSHAVAVIGLAFVLWLV